MASLRDIRRRIKSVESTQQITKAMKMVAASRLKKSESLLTAFRPYADGFATVMGRLSYQLRDLNHPLLASPGEEVAGKKQGLILVTTDRGLCGGFNAILNHRFVSYLSENQDAEILPVCIGRKGRDFLRRKGIQATTEYVNVLGDLDFDLAEEIVSQMLKLKQEQQLDSIHILYSRFRSAISQDIVVEPLLPVKPPKLDEFDKGRPYLFEPDGESALEAVLKQSLTIHVYRALLESVTSENGARMTAMDNATENALELIESLTLSLNRARQAVITNEILEIISGADALKA